MGFNADAEISKVDYPEIKNTNHLLFLLLENNCNHFPEYSCNVSIKMGANFGVAIEGSCEGGGTSETSAQEACDQAYEALSVCARMAARYGLKRISPPPIAPLPNGGGSW